MIPTKNITTYIAITAIASKILSRYLFNILFTIASALTARNAVVIDKPTFGYLGWELLKGYDEVTLVGTCTEICVVSNALILKAQHPSLQVKVLAKLCAGTTPENHDCALTTMRCCQVEVVE